ncbi:hypothetical protein ASE04_09565 [Rhizobium sp. Root708]|uniref:right-handed parallel beta-helix repeat-containing protein n=1 Tax=Rhizobium sp. Root708 TaxID=1736592 RepID=UPI0006F736D5|nr:hypothetical protein [Rhizobium sp. Root708]KRB51773.1 hypothetical protein ASE04_09565 [Rhizobium sp. Root708]
MPTDIWKARVERRGKDLLAPSLVAIALLGAGITAARAETITVSPVAKGGEGMTIQQALDKAQPGDTIMLAPGTYLQDLRSVRDGQQGRAIVIKGSRSSIVSGGGQPRVIEINHDFIELRGFTVDGHFEAANTKDSYRDKLIYVIGNQPGRGPNGLKILNMDIRNAGGECVRLRYQARNNEIANSRVTSCGHADFKFKDGGKNGEGIYIGTAPEQLGQRGAPDRAVDHSDNNHIHDNVINTAGNECVDIKEGSSGNIVERNSCTGQKDPESGGFDSRGNANVFRNNTVFNVRGTGVRLGGDGPKDGLMNDVYGNTFRNVGVGLVRAQRAPQGKICGNISQNNKSVAVNDIGKALDPTGPCDGPRATADGRTKVAAQPKETASREKPEKKADKPSSGLIKDGPALACRSSVAGCIVGRIEGDARNRIKIFDASDVDLRGHHLILATATGRDGKAIAVKSLAGKVVRVEYAGIEEKKFSGARIVEVMDR